LRRQIDRLKSDFNEYSIPTRPYLIVLPIRTDQTKKSVLGMIIMILWCCYWMRVTRKLLKFLGT